MFEAMKNAIIRLRIWNAKRSLAVVTADLNWLYNRAFAPYVDGLNYFCHINRAATKVETAEQRLEALTKLKNLV